LDFFTTGFFSPGDSDWPGLLRNESIARFNLDSSCSRNMWEWHGWHTKLSWVEQEDSSVQVKNAATIEQSHCSGLMPAHLS